jgi:hypothetical protein
VSKTDLYEFSLFSHTKILGLVTTVRITGKPTAGDSHPQGKIIESKKLREFSTNGVVPIGQ